ncbi:hypothetical protein IAI27_11030, partial [Streptococcus pseudopneumoniae]|uniref:hypothetical protein n=1 Tax=Streptococcus pseudopneumoniae TaxID=257758 RepID=UPI0018B02E60
AYAEHIASEFPGSTWGRGGDEFLVDGASREEIDEKMARVRAKMAAEKFEITLADGSIATLEGVQFSYGTGATESEADANLKQDKSDRK